MLTEEVIGQSEQKEKDLVAPMNTSNRNPRMKGAIGKIFSRLWGTDHSQRKNQSFLDIVDSGFASVKDASLEAFKLPSGPKDIESKDASKDLSLKNKSLHRGVSDVDQKDQKKSDEEDVHATFKYLSIMTALYLPFLLFLWIRRNVLGTGSLVRSLFFGHMLRYGVAFLLLPPSVTKSFVPESMWNFGVKCLHRLEKWWKDEKIQAIIPTWVHFVLKIVLGINTYKNTSSLGSQIGNNVGISPPLMALGIFTLLLFVVHPDGLTWIMLGQMRESLASAVERSAKWIHLVRSGEVKLTAAHISSTIATLIIVFTIINSVVSNWNKDTKSSTVSREKAKIKNSKKGKKGRGRNQHVISKVKILQLPENKPLEDEILSQSRSPSPPRNRCLSDMEDTTISTGSDSNIHCGDHITSSLPSIPQIEEENPALNTRNGSYEEDRIRRETKNIKARGILEDSCKLSSKVSTQNSPQDLSNDIIDEPDKEKKTKKLSKSKKAGASLSSAKLDHESATDVVVTLQRPINSKSATPRIHMYNPDARKGKETRSMQRAPVVKEKKMKSTSSSNEAPLREKRQVKNEFTIERDSSPHVSAQKLKINAVHKDSISSQRYEPPAPCVDQYDNFVVKNAISSATSDGGSHIRQHTLESYPFEPSGYIHSAAKMELSSFLSKIGLHETELNRLPSVESLNQLTDYDYDRLGIDAVKRTVINSALEVRSMYHGSRSNQKVVDLKTTKIRAPPGLCSPVQKCEHKIEDTNTPVQSASLFSSTIIPAASQYSFSVGSSMNSLGGMHAYSEHSENGNGNPQHFNSVSDHVILPPLSPLRQDSPPHSNGSQMYRSDFQGDEDVEAEMEVLGGQMAVSILDF